MRNFPKLMIVLVALLLMGGVLFYNFKSDEKSEPVKSFKEIKQNKLEKNSDLTTVNPPAPTPEASSGKFAAALATLLERSNADVKTMSIEEIDEEIEEIQSFFDEEDIINQLNNNQVSDVDRQEIGKLLARSNDLKQARIEYELKKLQQEVNNYQKVHPKRLKNYLKNTDK